MISGNRSCGKTSIFSVPRNPSTLQRPQLTCLCLLGPRLPPPAPPAGAAGCASSCDAFTNHLPPSAIHTSWLAGNQDFSFIRPSPNSTPFNPTQPISTQPEFVPRGRGAKNLCLPVGCTTNQPCTPDAQHSTGCLQVGVEYSNALHSSGE